MSSHRLTRLAALIRVDLTEILRRPFLWGYFCFAGLIAYIPALAISESVRVGEIMAMPACFATMLGMTLGHRASRPEALPSPAFPFSRPVARNEVAAARLLATLLLAVVLCGAWALAVFLADPKALSGGQLELDPTNRLAFEQAGMAVCCDLPDARRHASGVTACIASTAVSPRLLGVAFGFWAFLVLALTFAALGAMRSFDWRSAAAWRQVAWLYALGLPAFVFMFVPFLAPAWVERALFLHAKVGVAVMLATLALAAWSLVAQWRRTDR